MLKYIVICLSVGGSSNRIFEKDDIVDDSCFSGTSCAELEAQGFLKCMEKDPEQSTDESIFVKITQGDLDRNPQLVVEDYDQVGDVVEVKVSDLLSEQEAVVDNTVLLPELPVMEEEVVVDTTVLLPELAVVVEDEVVESVEETPSVLSAAKKTSKK